MEFAGVKPDSIVLGSIIPGRAHPLSLRQGTEIHGYVIKKSGFESSLLVKNALTDLYTKRQSIDSACQVFDKMQMKDMVSWNTIIPGYGQCGSCVKKLCDIFIKRN